MNTLNRWTWVGAGLFLVGCAAPMDETGQTTALLEKDVEQTGDQLENKINRAGEDVGEGAKDVGKEVGEGAEEVGEGAKEVGKDVGRGAKDVGEDVGQGELGQPQQDVFKPGQQQPGEEPKATTEAEGPTGQKADEIIVGPYGGAWRGGFGPWGGGFYGQRFIGPWGGGFYGAGLPVYGGGFYGGPAFGWNGLGYGVGYGYSTGYSCGLYGCVGY